MDVFKGIKSSLDEILWAFEYLLEVASPLGQDPQDRRVFCTEFPIGYFLFIEGFY